jgi:hypothetical protein
MAYKHHDAKVDYRIVTFVDVHNLLPFGKKQYQTPLMKFKEEARIEKEVLVFASGIGRRAKLKIHFIGHEKDEDDHTLRFIIEQGGYIEMHIDRPLSMNAHFISQDRAELFATALKESLRIHIPEHPVKELMIKEIKIEDGFINPPVSKGTWSWMHRYTVRHAMIGTIVALMIFGTLEFTKLLIGTGAIFTSQNHTILFAGVTAIIIAFTLEPLRNWIDKLLEKII